MTRRRFEPPPKNSITMYTFDEGGSIVSSRTVPWREDDSGALVSFEDAVWYARRDQNAE